MQNLRLAHLYAQPHNSAFCSSVCLSACPSVPVRPSVCLSVPPSVVTRERNAVESVNLVHRFAMATVNSDAT